MRISTPFSDWAKTVLMPDGTKLSDNKNRGVQALIFSSVITLPETEQDNMFVQALAVKADLRKFAAIVASKNLDANPIFDILKKLEDEAKQKIEAKPEGGSEPAEQVVINPRPVPAAVGQKLVVTDISENSGDQGKPVASSNLPILAEVKTPRVIIRAEDSPQGSGAEQVAGSASSGGSNTQNPGGEHVINVPPPPMAKVVAPAPRQTQSTRSSSLSGWFKHPVDSFQQWWRTLTSGRGRSTGGSSSTSSGDNSKTVKSVVLSIVLAAIAVPLFVLIYNNTSTQSYSGDSQGFSEEAYTVPAEEPPVAPDSVPLNTTGSIQKQGFLGSVQLFVVTTSLLIVFTLVGDRWFNKQNSDAVYTLILSAVAILFSFPAGLVWTIGAIVVLILIIGFVWVVSTQGEGADFSNLAAWSLIVGSVGGLVASRISVVTNLFPTMQFTNIIPLVELTYYLQTMNLKGIYPTLIVDLFIFVGTGVAVYELLRKSEDGTSPIGPIISVIFGLLGYGLFLHVFNLDAWISVLIGTLVSVGVSAGSISPAGRQLVPREWGNKSPFDGAMLLLGILLSLVLIMGANPWLIGF